MNWRVGNKIKLNVYQGERPVCQCHTEEDAQAMVDAMNKFASDPRREIASRAANLIVEDVKSRGFWGSVGFVIREENSSIAELIQTWTEIILAQLPESR